MSNIFKATNIRKYLVPRFCNMQFNLCVLHLNTKRINDFAEEVLRGANFACIEIGYKHNRAVLYSHRISSGNLYSVNKLIRKFLFLYMASLKIFFTRLKVLF